LVEATAERPLLKVKSNYNSRTSPGPSGPWKVQSGTLRLPSPSFATRCKFCQFSGFFGPGSRI